jgi:hypothetical protein
MQLSKTMTHGYDARRSGRNLTRLYEMNRRKARRESTRVRWSTLADAVEQYIEYRALVLWFRAIQEAEGGFPEQLIDALEARCPGFVANSTEPQERGANGDSEPWLRLIRWIDENFFQHAKAGGWHTALRFYAAADWRWEQLWTYWEQCDERWRNNPPAGYPSFEEWRQAAKACPLPRPHVPVKRAAWDAARLVGPDRLQQAVATYMDWEAFVFWVRAIVEADRQIPSGVAERIRERCPGFLEETRPADGDIDRLWLQLLDWIEARSFGFAKSEGWFEAITFFARSHLRAERTVDYWAHCAREWSRRRPEKYPDFADWRQAADAYTA